MRARVSGERICGSAAVVCSICTSAELARPGQPGIRNGALALLAAGAALVLCLLVALGHDGAARPGVVFQGLPVLLLALQMVDARLHQGLAGRAVPSQALAETPGACQRSREAGPPSVRSSGSALLRHFSNALQLLHFGCDLQR